MLCATIALAVAAPATAQVQCPQAAHPTVESGWQLYRSNDLAGAAAAFQRAARMCANDVEPIIGLGYVALRNGEVATARTHFDTALRADSTNADALSGRGVVAWRDGDTDLVRKLFLRVQSIDPTNAEALDYLQRVPPRAVAPVRPRLVLPDTTVYPSRTNGDHFEVRTANGWEPFYIKGMNLGAALPGKHPSEFPDSSTYVTWIQQMADMGVNTVRVYTIHPPHFYQALRAYNLAHQNTPLRIVHGVWTELPPEHNFDDTAWKSEFFTEMERVVDLLHGRADIPLRAGHAGGFYTADVTPWTLAYIIGREWEPYAVEEFNAMSKRTNWRGKYLDMPNGTPADAWMAEASEHIVAYEMDTYRAQRPVAYTNWPTLDPLTHPTETTVKTEVAIRRGRGEVLQAQPKEYDNDGITLDANLITPTRNLPAGWFVSYHAYPYYPDFMVYDTAFARAASSEGRSNYFGYLQALKRHHASMPIVISEYGLPASIGIAHFQPQGWNHGGVTEAQMATADARMTREIAEAGMAGGMLFAWIDEWFKKNWIVIDHEIPLERNRLWYNRLDAEQHYGMYAMDAEPPVKGASLAERLPAWRQVPPLYEGGGARLRVASDAAYLWLLYEPAAGAGVDELMIGFDVLDAARGDTRWPDKVGGALPVGLEFVLRIKGDTARLVSDHAANPWLVRRIEDADSVSSSSLSFPADAPGFATGRFEMHINPVAGSATNSDGQYSTLLVSPNRRRFTRDTTEIPAMVYDRGWLRPGNAPDGMWERLADGSTEVRIPWMLLNFTDPSQRRVLDNRGTDEFSEIRTTAVDGIRIAVRSVSGKGAVSAWPSGGTSTVARYTWPTWEEPEWTTRKRSVYDVMKATFAGLVPPALR